MHSFSQRSVHLFMTMICHYFSNCRYHNMTHGFQSDCGRWGSKFSRQTTRINAIRRPIRPASTEKKLAERKAAVESRQIEALRDPTLLTDLSFADCDELHPSSKRALIDGMGLKSMTEVQAKTFYPALAGSDVLARARTGTGKTLAFLVPVIERISRNPTFLPGNNVGCLIIAPTRELAIQIGDEAEKLLRYHSDLSVQVMYGGTKMARDMNALNNQLPTILVATPGRLLEHLHDTNVRGRKFSDDIIARTDILVLDEIDRLLDMGFRKDILSIMSYLPRKEKRQTMLFSATIPTALRGVMRESMRDDFLEVNCVEDGTSSTPTNLRVTQSHVVLSDMSSIVLSIYVILKQIITVKPYKVIVFFPTARMVSFFADFFSDGLDFPVIDLHSKKSQSSRNTATENFKRAQNAIMFTSDLSARGIDYPDVTQVIQVGMPDSRDQYIHRLGRTARAGRGGEGLLLLFPFEARFLFELKGLEIPLNDGFSKLLHTLPELDMPEWMMHNFDRVRSRGNRLSTSAQLAYLAFLGYYIGELTRNSAYSREEVVRLSNEFCMAIGLNQVPSLSQKLLSKMGLEGIPGIVMDDEESSPF